VTSPAPRTSEAGADAPFAVARLDHLVLTVADIERSVAFYERALGMRAVMFGDGRRALEFGQSKINLHLAGHEIPPHAARPVPGTADLCLVTDAGIDRIVDHLTACGTPIELGPVPRTGARGPVLSCYVRDPDRNLVEISTYVPGRPEPARQ
jgi:catechol 2,3-dioxygenase-like lactoylglutathione lyase family enzyme